MKASFKFFAVQGCTHGDRVNFGIQPVSFCVVNLEFVINLRVGFRLEPSSAGWML